MNQLFETQIPATLEQERRTRQKAELENQAKDEFLAFSLHELKNQLNTIYGWTHLLSKVYLDKTQTKKAIDAINRKTVFLNELVEDLLDVARITSGKMKIEFSRVDLRQVIKDALEDCHPTADRKNIALAASYDCSYCEISGDAKRLRQVVDNMLNNAVKFTPSGGFVSIDLQRTEKAAEIIIRDSGIGIESKFLPFIFDRFRQAEGDCQCRENDGLGLGLAVVRHLVELHHGSVEVQSGGAGKGTAFTVSLPIS